MKKIYIIILSLLIMGAAGYLVIRYGVLKTDLFESDESKAKNILDLRPRLVAKLQELVYDGSDGLYRLEVDSFDIDLSDKTLDFTDAVLRYDTGRLHYLDSLKMAPDDLYFIRFNTLHVDGITIDELLTKNNISVKGIFLDQPQMKVYTVERPYNAVKRSQRDSLSLYNKIMGNLTHISAEKIIIKDGSFQNTFNYSARQPSSFNGISVEMNNLLIDKSTEFDASRILFAKNLQITTKDYLFRTADSLYNIKSSLIRYLSSKRRLEAYDVRVEPRLNEKAFSTAQQYRGERYDVRLQKVLFSNIDWWSFINNKKLQAKELIIPGGRVNIYLDRSLPVNSSTKTDNFPHQLFMKMNMPVDIQKLSVKKINLAYKEFNPETGKTGIVYIDSINLNGNNISNTRLSGNSRFITIDSRGLLMHKFPITIKLSMDKQKALAGNFKADVVVNAINDKEPLNQVVEPLGGFLVKKGSMQGGEANIEGDNTGARASVKILYQDLAIQPLKKDKNNPDKLKKKTLTGIIANLFVIKHSNPSRGDAPRVAEITYVRKPHASFANLIWKAILLGVLDTVGIPEKFAE
ncbi:MAG: hypothetical protein ABIR81_12335 [Ginsengibacter sp.]